LIEFDPDASNPDPEVSEIEYDSDGNEIPHDTKDGTINISSSILYPSGDKNSKSAKVK